MRRIKLIALVLFIALAATMAGAECFMQRVAAKPAFMDRYNHDPYAVPKLRGKCTVCHIGRGGGERNDFGEAFEDSGYRITPKLREKFPALFLKKSLADSGAAGGE